MPPEHNMIDLDEHEQGAAQRSAIVSRAGHFAERKAALRLFAALAVGVMLGGASVQGLRDARERQERNSIVSLVSMPASIDGVGMDSNDLVQMNGKLALINAGPASITVLSARAQRSGALIHDAGQSRLLRPGGTSSIDVEALFECSLTAFGPQPLSMQFRVQTADGQVKEAGYPIALNGSLWHREISDLCSRAMERIHP
ncbi:hypothetical protein ACIA7R_27870 [Micromonospora chalcea]